MADGRSDEIAEYYDSYSTWYEGERREGYYSLINDLEVQALCAHARGRDILECGVGTGLLLERTAEVARTAHGVDLSFGMASVSKAKGLSVSNSVVGDLPFPDDSFDLVYSCKVLPHVADIAGALAELARVTRPDGTIMVEFYNPVSFKGLSYWLNTRRRGHEPVFVRHDTATEVARYVPDSWEIVHVRGIRVFAVVGQMYTLPGLGRALRSVETRVCDTRLGRLFGGYLLLTLRQA